MRFNADFRDALSENLGELPVIGTGLAWIVDGALASFMPASRGDLVSSVEGGLQSLGNPVGATVTLRTTIHHIATNKNLISRAAGGPYTPRFRAIFERARMTLESALNKIPILGHRGPHPEYNRVVYQRLRSAVDGLDGVAYREALERELVAIGQESATMGTVLNRLLTGE
ncbi:MAG: hypothetical protein F9K16_05115 [Thermoanaerobaculia bacterium]|nr:MAG: hypothetical protein F9K16_05115 [Thermoanaerobaculia bacterium]